MAFRVAVLGIHHETNTFIEQFTSIKDFKDTNWLKGSAIRNEYSEAFHEIGGVFEIMDKEEVQIIPVFYARAVPSGIITDEAFNEILRELIFELDKVLPIDGCIAVAHGAAVSEQFKDMDGHWLSVLRKRLGENVPIVCTLDPHANVSELMISATNCLIAYKTNPHIDQRETGKEAATLMVNILKQKVIPKQVLIQLPLAISIEQQFTQAEPCRELYSLAHNLSEKSGILSISIILGFPYADVVEMGSSFVVVVNEREELAFHVGEELKSFVMEHLAEFSGEKISFEKALSIAKKNKKPVLFLDMGDNVGGGGSGNSLFLLKALEQKNSNKFFICINDPEAVIFSKKFKINETFELPIKDSDKTVFILHCKLLKLAEGFFKENKPRHGGRVNFNMGMIAIVSTYRGNIIMLTSRRTPPFSLKQLTTFDIFPKDFDIVIAKGVNAPIAAYEAECPTIIQVDTPGPTRADMTKFSFKNRRKPLFPFESID